MAFVRALAVAVLLWPLIAGGCSHANRGRTETTATPQSDLERLRQTAFSAVKNGKLADARGAWEEALKLSPNDPYVLTNLGLVEDMLGQREKALMHAARAAQLHPQSPGLAVNYGAVLENNGHEGQAVGEYRRALELDPRFEPALLALGTRALLAGNHKEARRFFSDAVRFHPDRADGYAGLAAVEASQRKWAQAAALMQKAAERRSGDEIFTAAAGALFYRAGDMGRAAKLLDRALEANAHLGDAYVIRAEIAWSNGEYARAQQLLERAVKVDSAGERLAGSALRRGELTLELDRPDLAERALLSALRQRKQPEAWRGRANIALGMMAVRRHDYARAAELFEAAKKSLGETAQVTAGLAAARHGLALTGPKGERQARLNEAETWYRRSLQSAENPHLRVALGRLYLELAQVVEPPYRRGKYRLAELQLREAVRLRPGLVEPQVRLGLLMEELGRVGEARAAFEQALALDPQSSRIHFLYAGLLRRQADRSKDETLTSLAHHHYAQASKLDRRHLAAKIGWYVTAATTDTAPEAATSETIIVPFGEEATDGTEPTLEDLLPFFETEEDGPQDVIPIEEGDRFPLYNIESTAPAVDEPAVLEP